MKRRYLVFTLLVAASALLLSSLPVPAAAQESSESTAGKAVPAEEWSVTQHSIKIGGQTVPYQASAGMTTIKNDAGEPTGRIYSVAYTRTDVKDPSRRPVAFLYNGGPGSATMWLHMGAFGPRRVATVNGEYTGPPPYKLVDNAECLLDATDLVFIDAMGTGYSHLVGEGKGSDYYGVDEDADAFARFILEYLSRNDRWNAPKFLIGESYGTFRSAVLGNLLSSRYSVDLNGIVLISSVLDLSTITFGPGDDRCYVYYLPSYAAVAWYHKALADRPVDLESFIQEARTFAAGDYADALMKGDALSESDKRSIAGRVSEFTGLSVDYLVAADLRVPLQEYMVELLRDRGLTAGRIDARFTGYTFDLLSQDAEIDPEGPAVGGAFTALINRYNHTELGFGKDRVYNNFKLDGSWNWNRGGGQGGFFPGSPNVQDDLAIAMINNPHLQVQVENGYYDLATPFFPTEYTMSHLGLPPEVQKNITLDYYNAGHMMYLQDSDRVSLHDNIARLIARAAGK